MKFSFFKIVYKILFFMNLIGQLAYCANGQNFQDLTVHQESLNQDEKFLMRTLLKILDSKSQLESMKRSYESVIRQDSEKGWGQMVCLVAGSIVSLILMLAFIEKFGGFENNFLKTSFLIGGTLSAGFVIGTYIFFPLLRFVIWLFSGGKSVKPEVYRDTLEVFVRNWPFMKTRVPLRFHGQFDDLYLRYVQEGADLTVDEDEAAVLIRDVIQKCLGIQNEKLSNEMV